MVYAYAIRRAGGSGVDGRGLDDAPLRVVGAGSLEAVVSDCDRGARAPTEERLWTHDRVVDSLTSDGTLLPTRFGMVLEDDDAVSAILRERAEELGAALRRVDGAIELAVRVVWPGEADAAGGGHAEASASSGKAYLMSMVDRRRRARELADRVDAPLRELARESRRRVLARPDLPLSASYLVERERAGAFRDRVTELRSAVADAEIVCTGPWAPYGFASAPVAGAAA